MCIGNVNPHASPVFHSVCKPGRRAPEFSQPFYCPTEQRRLICSARWAALVSASWLNRDSRRASAHPVKPFNQVNGKKARRLYKPTKTLRRAKIKLWLCNTVKKRSEVEVSRRRGGWSKIKGSRLLFQRSLRSWATSTEPRLFIRPPYAKQR